MNVYGSLQMVLKLSEMFLLCCSEKTNRQHVAWMVVREVQGRLQLYFKMVWLVWFKLSASHSYKFTKRHVLCEMCSSGVFHRDVIPGVPLLCHVHRGEPWTGPERKSLCSCAPLDGSDLWRASCWAELSSPQALRSISCTENHYGEPSYPAQVEAKVQQNPPLRHGPRRPDPGSSPRCHRSSWGSWIHNDSYIFILQLPTVVPTLVDLFWSLLQNKCPRPFQAWLPGCPDPGVFAGATAQIGSPTVVPGGVWLWFERCKI